MFTGIVEETGTIKSLRQEGSNLILSIESSRVYDDLKFGDSIAIDGVCQTVTQINNNIFEVCAIQQTLSLTNFSQYKLNTKVNLERPLRLGDRLGGHLVQGHVDGIAKVIDIKAASGDHSEPGSIIISLEIPQDLIKYIIPKGSVTLNGISLTVAEKSKNQIKTCLIPTTLAITNTSLWEIGSVINVEVDMLAKYFEAMHFPKKDSTNNS